MKAIQIDLGSDTHALGVVFADGYVYAHEPIADGYSSEADLLADLVGAQITVLGAFVPVDIALSQLEEQVKSYVAQHNAEIKRIMETYEQHLLYYDELKTLLEGYKQVAEASQTC